METLQRIIMRIKGVVDRPFITLGDTPITILSVLYVLLLVFLLFYLSAKIKVWVVDRLLSRRGVDPGVRESTGTIVRYVLIFVGFLVILQTVGIDLTTLNILTGAVGIGVGFGLQNIANNFISGIIILFEQPVKTGDRIAVGDVEGDVTRIGARSTTVLTNDNIEIIIPNSKLITENVVNWTLSSRRIRFRIPVTVAFNSDVRQVETLLLEAAKDVPDILEHPEPGVRFIAFGENGYEFELRAWTTSLLQRRGRLVSSINFAIYDKFKQHDIVVPNPQRDVHIRTGIKVIEDRPEDRSNDS